MASKDRARQFIQCLLYLSGISAFRAQRQGAMRIVMFHGVGEDDYPADVFEAQLKYLAKYFSIVPLESILDKVTSQNPSFCNEVALTFDDGLRNHYTVVYPILKRLGISATFFVCPGLIERGLWLWNHEARERLRSLSIAHRASLCSELQIPGKSVKEMIDWMKSLGPDARKRSEEALRKATPNFKPTDQQRKQYDIMSWHELESMDPNLITIGSHSVSHPILTTLNPVDLSFEIRASRRLLEERLQRPIENFCYTDKAINASVIKCVGECYRSAVTSIPGKVMAGDDLYSLRRIPTTYRLPALAWRMHRMAG